MKKNNGKLLWAIIGIVLALLISIFAGKDLIRDSLYDNELADGYKVVYQVSSDDAAIVKQTADVIAKRYKLLGASAADTAISDSEISVIVTGLESLDTIRPMILRSGDLSFRNSDDEFLMDASVLDPVNPLSISTSNDQVYIQIKVKDGDTFQEKTRQIISTTSKMMVLWVDFVEGTSNYETESAKNIPSYLGAASVSSAINGDCYITTHHSLQSAKELVALVSSGKLPAAITEKSSEAVTAKYGASAARNAFFGIIISLAVLCIDLIRSYGIIGCGAGLLSFAYTAAYFKACQLLGVVVNKNLIIAYAVSLAVGTLLVFVSLGKARNELLKGRNIVSSYDEAFASTLKSDWEAVIAMIVTGLVITLFYRTSLLPYAAGITAGGVCNMLFFVLWNRKLASDLNSSNYFSKKLYMIRESDLPDVEKGEHYVNEKKKNFNAYAVVANKAALAVSVIIALIGAGVLLTNAQAALKILVVGAVAICLTALYVMWQYRKYVRCFAAAVCALLAGAAVAYLFAMKLTDANAGWSLIALAAALAIGFAYFGELNANYRRIAREKITEEKIANTVNQAFDALGYPLMIALAVTLIIAVLTRTNSYGATMLFVISVFVELVVFTYFWVIIIRKGNKGNKARKKTRKELRENTIFGINEQR